MSNDNYYYGKDGGKYKDIFEKNAADTRYDQHQKLIQAQNESNNIERQRLKLLQQEQEERNNEHRRKAQKDEFERKVLIAQLESQLEEYYKQHCIEVGVDYNIISLFRKIFAPKIEENEENEILEKIKINQDLLNIIELKEETSKLRKEIFLKYTINIFRYIKEVKIYNQMVKELSNKNIKLNELMQEYEDYINFEGLQSREFYNKEIKQAKEELNKLLIPVENAKTLKLEFNEFRKKHYNEDMEILFKKIDLEIEPIKEKQIIKKGKKEDYMNFIKTKILEN